METINKQGNTLPLPTRPLGQAGRPGTTAGYEIVSTTLEGFDGDITIRIGEEEITYRLWRLYMAGCAYCFDEGSIGLHQVLAGHWHQPQPVPARRNDRYIQ